MTVEQGVRILERPGSLGELALAIGELIDRSCVDRRLACHLIKGLKYPGFIAEQAALGLYNRLGVPIPEDRSNLQMDAGAWQRLADSVLQAPFAK